MRSVPIYQQDVLCFSDSNLYIIILRSSAYLLIATYRDSQILTKYYRVFPEKDDIHIHLSIASHRCTCKAVRVCLKEIGKY